MKTRLLQTLIEEFSYYVQKNSGSQLDALEPPLEYNQDQINLPTIWKTRLLHTFIEEFSWYVKKFRLTVRCFRTTTGGQSGPDACGKSRFIRTFLTILGVTEILCSFRLVLERKTGKEIPESSRLEFLEKFSANNFALSDAEDNTSGPLNRGGIADLPLLRALFAIRQKSHEPSFWEVMNSFVLLANASSAASKALLQ